MARRPFEAPPARVVFTDQEWLLDKGSLLWHGSTQDPEHDDPLDIALREAVESLPEPYRSVIEMRFWGGMTYQAIAEELGWKNRTWTSTYLRRGMERLKRELQTSPLWDSLRSTLTTTGTSTSQQ